MPSAVGIVSWPTGSPITTRQIFSLTRLDEAIEIYDDEASALAAVCGGPRLSGPYPGRIVSASGWAYESRHDALGTAFVTISAEVGVEHVQSRGEIGGTMLALGNLLSSSRPAMLVARMTLGNGPIADVSLAAVGFADLRRNGRVDHRPSQWAPHWLVVAAHRLGRGGCRRVRVHPRCLPNFRGLGGELGVDAGLRVVRRPDTDLPFRASPKPARV